VTTVSEFTPEPKDETVFVGDTSHFACGTLGSSLEWKINGTFLKDLPDESRRKFEENSTTLNLGFQYSTIKIPGAAKYNGTKVQCVSGEDIESNIATMYVQGTLSAVVNARVRITEKSIIVFWVAPFSLNISHRDLDMWYSVFLKDKTEQRQISCSNCTNIPETNFTLNDLDQCHEYTVTIVPVNGAGEGEKYHIPFVNVPNSSSACNNSEDPTVLVPKHEGETGEKGDSSLLIGLVGGACCIVFAVLVVGLLALCVYKRKKQKKIILQEVGYSSVDTHQIEVEVSDNRDGEGTEEEEIPGNSEPAGEMCPVKEVVEEEGEERTEPKTEEEEQEEGGKSQGPFVEPETERVDNSQVTGLDTAAQPQDDTNPETVVCITSSGQCIPRNSSSSNNLASSEEKLASDNATIQEQSVKVVTSDEGSEESSEFVVREPVPVRNKRTTQNLRESLATQEPISAAMSNPYQPSPQPHDNQDITL
jgi:hypothetical protein